MFFTVFVIFIPCTVSPSYSWGLRSIHANPENPPIIDAVIKRLCMILYSLKYALKSILKTVLLINTAICSNDKLKTVIMQHNMYHSNGDDRGLLSLSRMKILVTSRHLQPISRKEKRMLVTDIVILKLFTS